jgi:hypothetical protein
MTRPIAARAVKDGQHVDQRTARVGQARDTPFHLVAALILRCSRPWTAGRQRKDADRGVHRDVRVVAGAPGECGLLARRRLPPGASSWTGSPAAALEVCEQPPLASWRVPGAADPAARDNIGDHPLFAADSTGDRGETRAEALNMDKSEQILETVQRRRPRSATRSSVTVAAMCSTRGG